MTNTTPTTLPYGNTHAATDDHVNAPTVQVSKWTSTYGIVKACEQALLASRDYAHKSGCATIFVVQALPYTAGITGDPWSKNFPTVAQVIERIRERTGIVVEITA